MSLLGRIGSWLRRPCPPPTAAVPGNQLLAGQNVLITGAGKNIGRAIALEMAGHGAAVYYTDNHEGRLTDLRSELATLNATGEGFLSDVARLDDSSRLCSGLDRGSVGIDILVNNVGYTPYQVGLERFDATKWQKTFNTNIVGPLHLTHLVTESMKTRQTPGSVIFLSSVHQFMPSPWPDYAAAKAAIGKLVEDLAFELAPYDIRVNGIAPGNIGLDNSGRLPVDTLAPLRGTSIPPDYIAHAALFLASDTMSRFTTGAMLRIDAGKSLFHARGQAIKKTRDPRLR